MNSDAHDRVLASLEAAWQLPALVPPHEAPRRRPPGRWLHALLGWVRRSGSAARHA